MNEEQQKRIRKEVEQRLESYKMKCNLPVYSVDQREHVISIGVSILNSKWGTGPQGGSFVQAILKGDLYDSYGRADSTNFTAIPFYVMLVSNINYIE